MCLRGSCSGRVTEVKYGNKVVWECVGVGSGRDKWEVVVYKLTTKGVNPGVVAGGRLGVVLWGSHRTGQVFLIRLFYSDGVGGMVYPLLNPCPHGKNRPGDGSRFKEPPGGQTFGSTARNIHHVVRQRTQSTQTDARGAKAKSRSEVGVIRLTCEATVYADLPSMTSLIL